MVSRQYYRALYLDACRAVLPLLYKKERWIEMTGICEQAYRIDFAVEEFTAYQMRALIALGQAERALEVYEAFQEKLEQADRADPRAGARNGKKRIAGGRYFQADM